MASHLEDGSAAGRGLACNCIMLVISHPSVIEPEPEMPEKTVSPITRPTYDQAGKSPILSEKRIENNQLEEEKKRRRRTG